MIKFLIFAVLVGTTPTYANQAADVAAHAGGCWVLPSGLEAAPSAEFDVDFDDNGNVTDATVIRYSPAGDQGKFVVLSATEALQKCSPYSGVSGTVRVLMNAGTAFGEQKIIDPFK